MGLRRVSPVMRVGGWGWFRLDARHAALSAAIYTMCSSVLVTLMYGWRLVMNGRHPHYLQDVYYGVQISYTSTVCTHVTLIVLSSFLVIGIYKERCGMVTPWVVANITFMALEAVCCMYSNVLRDHINKKFDTMCKAEMTFFVTRLFLNILALWGVMRFYRNIRSGLTYKDPEAIEL
ncbi:uncharacterized protein LOC121858321 [Homarus americanus]|uniref:uncharacterized protein LOC121858321 n=1 Tax=Homarus americanus TaxID=6706 RepID=UPI001C497608|nr:uncharacterized protein LOC121858321 [Homarus americanus]